MDTQASSKMSSIPRVLYSLYSPRSHAITSALQHSEKGKSKEGGQSVPP